jgi:hypothetical protein
MRIVMTELISPAQANSAVLILSVLLIVIGGGFGFARRGARGLIACVPGLLIAPVWQLHLWLTRYDASSQTLGLTSLKVLLIEFVLFAILGMAMGWFFSFVWRTQKGNSSRQTSGE